eukprot:g3633.t1 g3633   contig12:2463085-2463747(-)
MRPFVCSAALSAAICLSSRISSSLAFTSVSSLPLILPKKHDNSATHSPSLTTTTLTTTTTTTTTTATTTRLHSSPLFESESASDTTKDDFEGFNPFQPGSKIRTKSGFGIPNETQPTSTPGGQISPRQMRMKELTTDLLARISSVEAVEELLQENEEFLLDQLNNLDAVLESDSVFTMEMTREERFVRYREVMIERIGSARAPVAKRALTLLMEFVLRRE